MPNKPKPKDRRKPGAAKKRRDPQAVLAQFWDRIRTEAEPKPHTPCNFQEQAEKLLDSLPPVERKIIEQRYGIKSKKD